MVCFKNRDLIVMRFVLCFVLLSFLFPVQGMAGDVVRDAIVAAEVDGVSLALSREGAQEALVAKRYRQDKKAWSEEKWAFRRLSHRMVIGQNLGNGLVSEIDYHCPRGTASPVFRPILKALCEIEENKARASCSRKARANKIVDVFQTNIADAMGSVYRLSLDGPKCHVNLVATKVGSLAQFPLTVQNASAAQISEANMVYAYCLGDASLNSLHNCGCYADEFLKIRMVAGADVGVQVISQQLTKACLK